jgi:hypothetical protein
MNHFKGYYFLLFAIMASGFLQINAQVKYTSADERKDAGMGVERVARFFIPAYESARVKTDDGVLWVQIDLGAIENICI